MVTKAEKQWAKENGLKRTDLITLYKGERRIVYRANDGRLFYVNGCHYCGTFEDYCMTECK